MDRSELIRNAIMYFILPVWLDAGFADYLCHRRADIEHTSGYKESLLHLLQFGEMAVPILAAMFLEINALIILIMIVCFLLHEMRRCGTSATRPAPARSRRSSSTCTASWKCCR
jgi:hypothetical protein